MREVFAEFPRSHASVFFEKAKEVMRGFEAECLRHRRNRSTDAEQQLPGALQLEFKQIPLERNAVAGLEFAAYR